MKKRIVITGASSGLGKTLTADLAAQGHTLYALARSAEKLNELKVAHPDQIEVCAVDIADAQAVQKVFSEIGPADVLINNAGIFSSAPFHEESFENIDRIIDTNLKGLMYCTRAALPAMIEKKAGHIINISSVSGINGLPGQAIYGASKHGVQGFADVRVPMDEASASVILDLSGRSYLVFDAGFSSDVVGDLTTQMVPHFFHSLITSAENDHHVIEAIFKAFGIALARSAKVERSDVPSTKGVLTG